MRNLLEKSSNMLYLVRCGGNFASSESRQKLSCTIAGFATYEIRGYNLSKRQVQPSVMTPTRFNIDVRDNIPLNIIGAMRLFNSAKAESSNLWTLRGSQDFLPSPVLDRNARVTTPKRITSRFSKSLDLFTRSDLN
jgi:hypothetical protein